MPNCALSLFAGAIGGNKVRTVRGVPSPVSEKYSAKNKNKENLMKKKLLALLLTFALLVGAVSVLASCGCEHVDLNDDGKCDECEDEFSDGCNKHVDKNDDGKCDVSGCGATYSDGCDATHKDANDDGKCDVGGESFTDGCDNHVDANDDGKCDVAGCGKDFTDGCDVHKDANDDGKCDVAGCGKDYTDGCDNHVDANDDGKCDVTGCGKDFTDGHDVHVDADDDYVCDADGCEEELDDGHDVCYDYDDDLVCDYVEWDDDWNEFPCGKPCNDGCDNHVDANDDGKCDVDGCDEAWDDGCDNMVDKDGDGICDNCEEAMPGTKDNPIFVEFDLDEYWNPVGFTAFVEAGKTVYFTGYVSGMIVTIEGADLVLVVIDAEGNETTVNPVAGVITYEFAAGGIMMPMPVFAITNNGAEDADIVATTSYPEGSMNNPADLELGDVNLELDAGEQYYYAWVATVDGKLTITFAGNVTETVAFFFEAYNLSSYQMLVLSEATYDEANDVTVLVMDVTAGDEVQFSFASGIDEDYNPVAATVAANIAFEAAEGGEEGGEVIEPETSVTEDEWAAAFPFVDFTAEVKISTPNGDNTFEVVTVTYYFFNGEVYERIHCVLPSTATVDYIKSLFDFSANFASFTFADGEYTCEELTVDDVTYKNVVITLNAGKLVASVSYAVADDNGDVTVEAEFYDYNETALPEDLCEQIDKSGDNLCDYCGTCVHRDADDNDVCDRCEVAFSDGPEASECKHEDVDDDYLCDHCGMAYVDGCNHRDADDNSRCDKCNSPFEDDIDVNEIPETPDRTGKDYSAWGDTDVIMQLNLNSSGNELEALTKRYMAGESGDNERIDDLVLDRNSNAMIETGVYVTYTYLEETDKISWGKYTNEIQTDIATFTQGEDPDMYCGFAYDLSMSATLGHFKNLYNDGGEKGNFFTFLLDDYRPQYDDEGYLIDFMKSVTPLPDTKMYLYASNYTLDVIRSMYAIPVSVSLLAQIDVSDLPDGSDADDSGTYEINEFYDMVRDVQWTYDMMATLSAAIYSPVASSTENHFGNINGFVLDTGMGLPSAGMTYSTDFFWVNQYVDADGNYSYKVPETNANLEQMAIAYEKLFNTNGIFMSSANMENTQVGTSGAGMGIRQKFSEDKILFGGVVLVGALDYEAYQNMENGFGIAPIPLYATYTGAEYKTALHNLARVIGISKVSAYFSECTAFLDYQALNSDDVMKQYYRSLQYETVGGEEYNIEILDYLRDHIRSNRDQYLENICNNSAIGILAKYPDLNNCKWGAFFRNSSFKASEIRAKYEGAVTVKNQALAMLVEIYEALE